MTFHYNYNLHARYFTTTTTSHTATSRNVINTVATSNYDYTIELQTTQFDYDLQLFGGHGK